MSNKQHVSEENVEDVVIDFDEEINSLQTEEENEQKTSFNNDFQTILKRYKEQTMNYVDQRISKVESKLNDHENRLQNVEKRLNEQGKVLQSILEENEKELFVQLQDIQLQENQFKQKNPNILDQTLGTIGNVAHGLVHTAAFVLESVIDLATLGRAKRVR